MQLRFAQQYQGLIYPSVYKVAYFDVIIIAKYEQKQPKNLDHHLMSMGYEFEFIFDSSSDEVMGLKEELQETFKEHTIVEYKTEGEDYLVCIRFIDTTIQEEYGGSRLPTIEEINSLLKPFIKPS